MGLFFRELTDAGDARRPSLASDDGNGVWIHPSGQAAVLIDIDFSAGAAALLSSIGEVVGQQVPTTKNIKLHWQSLQTLPGLAGVAGVALIVSTGRELAWRAQGSVHVVAAAGLAPRFREAGVRSNAGTATIEGGEFFLATSGAVAPQVLASRIKTVEAGSYENLRRAIAGAAAGKAWHALLFPAESVSSFMNPSWPENPFVGVSESGSHERLGWQRLADALFEQPDFGGFRIIGGQHYAKPGGTRLVDGLLACPWGVFLLELKHFHGRVRLETQNRNNALVTAHPDGREIARHTNPVFKLEEALRLGKDHDLGARLDQNARKGALLLFTNSEARVTCVDPRGTSFGLPYTCGNVLIGTPATAAKQIREYAGFVGLSRDRPSLGRDVIGQIARRLGGDAVADSPRPIQPTPKTTSPRAAAQATQKSEPPMRIGRFLIGSTPLPDESTPRYDVVSVSVDGKTRPLWAKRYRLTSMGHSADLQDEVARVGREIAALQDLAREPTVQRYWEHHVVGLILYVILEPPEGQRLDHWLERQKPDRAARLRVLAQIASALAAMGAESIVHRALVPSNVRVNDDGRITLINFELCQLTSVATVDSRTRQSLDESFLPLEALTPGRQLLPADDAYSFGKLVCLVLAGRLPFGHPAEDVRFLAQPTGWDDFGRANDLSMGVLDGVRRLLARDRRRRPVGPELVGLVQSWSEQVLGGA